MNVTSAARRLIRGGVLVGAGIALASCSTTTYGTGVGPTAQTLQDIGNIVNFSQGEVIIYCARQPINQQPPPGAPLPPPIDPDTAPPPCPTEPGV